MALDITKLENVNYLGDGAFRCRCPACASQGGDKTGNHLYVDKDGAYGCAANKKDGEHNRTINALAGISGSGVVPARDAEMPRPILEIETFFKEEDLQKLLPFRDHWYERNISDDTLNVFKGGLATQFKMKDRYCFPIYDEKGRIHGFTGRWVLNTQPPFKIKWKHIGKTSNWVYPLFFNIKEIRAKRYVILVESIGDLLALWEAGIYNVLVIFGSSVSPILMARLVSLDSENIYVATNRDEKHSVGQDAAEEIKRKLDIFFDDGVVIIKLPPKKDFGETPKDEILKYREEIENARQDNREDEI